MFSRIAPVFLFALTAFTLLATAKPWGVTPTVSSKTVTATVTVTAPGTTQTAVSQCNTGPVQCCNSVQKASDLDADTNLLLGLLGVVLGSITGLVGVTCSPLSVIGVGGNSCSAQPVCCTNNSFHGLIALGCTPININL